MQECSHACSNRHLSNTPLPPYQPPTTTTAQLGVKAGLEFTAARRAAEGVVHSAGAQWESLLQSLLEQLPGEGREFKKEREMMLLAQRHAQQQQQQQRADGEEEEDEQEDAAEAGGSADSSTLPTRSPVSGVQIVLGDRPASETLKAMWAALTPWRRLQFCWEILQGLFEPVSAGLYVCVLVMRLDLGSCSSPPQNHICTCARPQLHASFLSTHACHPPHSTNPHATPCTHACMHARVHAQPDEAFIEAMKDDDLLTALFKEMKETFPELMAPLLHDRWAAPRAWVACAHGRVLRRMQGVEIVERCHDAGCVSKGLTSASMSTTPTRTPQELGAGGGHVAGCGGGDGRARAGAAGAHARGRGVGEP